jgi:predicted transcriptional regulator
LLAEAPIEAIWLRLRQLGRVPLARKLVEARACNAKVALEETDVAVAKLAKTIDGLTMADTGRFLQPDGKDQPW